MSHDLQTCSTQAKCLAWVTAMALAGTLSLGACSLDGLLKSGELPDNVTDPKVTETPQGARAAYGGAIAGFQQTFGASDNPAFIRVTGLMSDELAAPSHLTTDPVDLRLLDESPAADLATDALFTDLNNSRQRARQARGLVSDFLPQEPVLEAHLYALEGYSEVMLAELYCSGIPLSTVDYRGDYTLRPGWTTEAVFGHAVALFDTAIALARATDGVWVVNLSQVGRARALMGLGDYADAATAVAEVPDAFSYALHYLPSPSSPAAFEGIGWFTNASKGIWSQTTVWDREGASGLDWRTSGDPRTKVTQRKAISGDDDGIGDFTFYHPDKYDTSGTHPIVLASGVEARLIEAEAALQAGDPTWLALLNHLRQTAIVPALPDTTDPGSDTARISLVFRERAFWLFLTGHRQGDLRRLVRQYQRPREQVYPVGGGTYGGFYGQYIDAPIPWDERERNPQFTGCLSRD